MKCPYCGKRNNSTVAKTRRAENKVVRRRKCLSCGKRFTTHEEIADRTQLKMLREDRKSARGEFQVVNEKIATLWENQMMMVMMLHKLLTHFGVPHNNPLDYLPENSKKG